LEIDGNVQSVRVELWLIGLLVCVGCSDPPFPVAPVQGIVTIDGAPMLNGKIMFAPTAQGGKLNSGRPGFGHIQSDGSYTLSTYGDGDGAVIGQHWVSVINAETAMSAAVPKSVEMRATGKFAVNKHNFRRITFPRQTVTVDADRENKIDIALTSQDIAKYGKPYKADD
jgi:hypothetical protein